MSKSYYLHTLHGSPAVFDGRQVCFMIFHGRAPELAASLRQIRREQQSSKRYRQTHGFKDGLAYGYRRVRMPGPHGGLTK